MDNQEDNTLKQQSQQELASINDKISINSIRNDLIVSELNIKNLKQEDVDKGMINKLINWFYFNTIHSTFIQYE